MLFTHRGLSGPAMLQASTYWRESQPVEIDRAPGDPVLEDLRSARESQPRLRVSAWLGKRYPARLASYIASWPDLPANKQLAQLSKGEMDAIATTLKKWRVVPVGTEGWRTAEVTSGGIDTDGLSSRTMESKNQPGLYFIGECVDVTGWLGGYNFQWAWASADACAKAIA